MLIEMASTNDTNTTADVSSEHCDSFLFTTISSNDDPAFLPDQLFARPTFLFERGRHSHVLH